MKRSHGMSKTIIYGIWLDMKKRCFNPKYKQYKDYGGRGIEVCERWLGKDGFINFLNDMGKRPEGLTLDRYPNGNGNYEPSNCRWATRIQQNLNRRSWAKSKIRGITIRENGKYRASILVNGKRVSLGDFKCPLLASAAFQLKHDDVYGGVI
jgi:hypothetical protein